MEWIGLGAESTRLSGHELRVIITAMEIITVLVVKPVGLVVGVL